MSIRNNYKHTIIASYIGYITQAIVNNFAPLLFVTFNKSYGISLSSIGLLVTINFCTQIMVDLIAAKFTDRLGYRKCAVAAHVFAALGMILLGVLPEIMSNSYIGLCIAVVVYAIGGGLAEVIISPIVEACPTDGKSAAMSLLHSFYCWGSVLVVCVSTILFEIFGMEAWNVIACVWAIIPFVNIFYFMLVPINTLNEEGEGMTIAELLHSRLFWILAILMVCSGASELSVSQWASALAETGLNVSKTVGDLAGPCLFAILMGIGRVLHAKIGERIPLTSYLSISAVVCVIGYLMVTLSPLPVISLAGCGVCGIAVAVMWPGTYSLAAKLCKRGGTAMFALLAFSGDIGCSSGPTIVGYVSSAFDDNIKLGLLAATLFPALMIIGIVLCKKYAANQ